MKREIKEHRTESGQKGLGWHHTDRMAPATATKNRIHHAPQIEFAPTKLEPETGMRICRMTKTKFPVSNLSGKSITELIGFPPPRKFRSNPKFYFQTRQSTICNGLQYAQSTGCATTQHKKLKFWTLTRDIPICSVIQRVKCRLNSG